MKAQRSRGAPAALCFRTRAPAKVRAPCWQGAVFTTRARNSLLRDQTRAVYAFTTAAHLPRPNGLQAQRAAQVRCSHRNAIAWTGHSGAEFKKPAVDRPTGPCWHRQGSKYRSSNPVMLVCRRSSGLARALAALARQPCEGPLAAAAPFSIGASPSPHPSASGARGSGRAGTLDSASTRGAEVAACWAVRGLCTAPSGTVVAFPLAQTGEGIKECELMQWFVKAGRPACARSAPPRVLHTTSLKPLPAVSLMWHRQAGSSCPGRPCKLGFRPTALSGAAAWASVPGQPAAGPLHPLPRQDSVCPPPPRAGGGSGGGVPAAVRGAERQSIHRDHQQILGNHPEAAPRRRGHCCGAPGAPAHQRSLPLPSHACTPPDRQSPGQLQPPPHTHARSRPLCRWVPLWWTFGWRMAARWTPMTSRWQRPAPLLR